MTTLSNLLNKFGLKSLKLNVGVLQLEIESNDATRLAAWELYIELLTRITTQVLDDDEGDEEAALKSLYAIFPITREILRNHGPECVRLAYIAIPFLNQVLRPFTAKWHKKQLGGDLGAVDAKIEFREDLRRLRKLILGYTDLMGGVAGVESGLIENRNASH
jgi:hypothetical protein